MQVGVLQQLQCLFTVPGVVDEECKEPMACLVVDLAPGALVTAGGALRKREILRVGNGRRSIGRQDVRARVCMPGRFHVAPPFWVCVFPGLFQLRSSRTFAIVKQNRVFVNKFFSRRSVAGLSIVILIIFILIIFILTILNMITVLSAPASSRYHPPLWHRFAYAKHCADVDRIVSYSRIPDYVKRSHVNN